ncbi:MAG: hypothetical protein JWR26_3500 [Pedosphaera sp.]|nr:hypothetical protein [Pedosphaera sp.]
MNRKFLIILGACIVVWAGYLTFTNRQNAVAMTIPAGPEPPNPGASRLEVAQASEQATFEQQTQVRIAGLARMQAEHDLRTRAAAQTQAVHRDLRASHQQAWAAIRKNNWQTFQALRKESATSKDQQVRCTICDGDGYFDHCILCLHNDGKCITCQGTGRVFGTDYCPSCLGSGKCFLCAGRGKMACLFCDDGIISFKNPLPPEKMPGD